MKKSKLLTLLTGLASTSMVFAPVLTSCGGNGGDTPTSQCTITFSGYKAGGGTIDGTATITKPAGHTFGEFRKEAEEQLEINAAPGHELKGWAIRNQENIFDDSKKITSDFDLWGIFGLESKTITLDAGFGTFSSGDNKLVLDIPNTPTKLSDIENYEEPTFEGSLAFKYWLDGENNPITGDSIITKKTTITASYINKPSEFATDNWDTVIYLANQGKEALHTAYATECALNTDFPDSLIGLTREVEINGQVHKVRVVDEEHDFIVDSDEKAALTFEFLNLISDTEGNSLATPWNWRYQTTDKSSLAKNYNLPESTIYDALNGDENKYLDSWYTKGGVKPDTSYNKSVLQMLPYDLRNSIKEVTKEVAIRTNSVYTTTGYSTKLFLPTYAEMYKDLQTKVKTDEGNIYQFYNIKDLNINKIKHHVNINEISEQYSEDKTTITGQTIKNYAGYNESKSVTGNGSIYWMATPNVEGTQISTSLSLPIKSDGSINLTTSDGYNCYSFALPIAPLFCI